MAPTCSNLLVPILLVVSFHMDLRLKPMDRNKCYGNSLENHLHIGASLLSAYGILSSHVKKLDLTSWRRREHMEQE